MYVRNTPENARTSHGSPHYTRPRCDDDLGHGPDSIGWRLLCGEFACSVPVVSGRPCRRKARFRVEGRFFCEVHHPDTAARRQSDLSKVEPEARKRICRGKVNDAKKLGGLEPKPCQRLGTECKGPIEAHHEDYTRPLAVTWLCHAHHIVADRQRRARERAAR